MQINELFEIKHPIIQAPMAGGPTTPELVAAVSNAGALGSIGAGYLSAEQLQSAIHAVRKLTGKAFNVNVFIPLPHAADQSQLEEACAAINTCSQELGETAKPIQAPYTVDFDSQIEVILENRIPVFSCIFGVPDQYLIKHLRNNKTKIIGTATTPDEVFALEDGEVDAIVVQGSEAGGHRGSFLKPAEESLICLDNLLAQVVNKTKTPLIAAGGIATKESKHKLIIAGAGGVQIGTAFLCCSEAGINTAYREKILSQQSDNTVLTRVFSGGLARGISNYFTECMSQKTETILDYPVQNKLTKAMRDKAKTENNPEFMSLWCGRSGHLVKPMAAVELINYLVER